MSNRKKEKLWGTILGVITFVALIAGATYAWYSWSSGESILTGGTNCFTINYTAGNSIGSGANSPAGLGVSDSYTGGLYTDIKMAISNTCSVKGVGTIKLTTSSFKNSDGTSAVSLISDGNTLKYVVATVTNPNTSSETVTPITGCSGSITDTGQKSICDFDLTNLDAHKLEDILTMINKFIKEHEIKIFNGNYYFFNIYRCLRKLITLEFYPDDTSVIELIPLFNTIPDEELRQRIQKDFENIEKSDKPLIEKIEDAIIVAHHYSYDLPLAQKKRDK